MIVSIEKATEILKTGVVAIPTETVYGLAAFLHCPEAIQSIFTLKNRPPANPLIIHVASVDDLMPYVLKMPPKELTDRWPGPLTLVLPVQGVPDRVTAGLPTAAFRIPNHPVALELLKRTGPLVAPSANLSGRPSATSPKHVEVDFGRDFPVVDGGSSEKGLESTILSEKDGMWRILREGAITQEALHDILGYLPPIVKPEGKPECPGQMFRHYSPQAQLVKEGGEVVLGFDMREYGKPVVSLGDVNHPEKVAARLYDALREIDERGYKSARVDLDFPTDGLWRTIRERLLKAMN